MKFSNALYRELQSNDLLICTVGFEPRSYYLLETNIESRDEKNTLVFRLCPDEQVDRVSYLLNERNITQINCEYNESSKVIDEICTFIERFMQTNDLQNVYIDYSSMPRSWYCALPKRVSHYSSPDRNVAFLYTAGDYPYIYKDYPTSGIDSIHVFSGHTFPVVDIKRYHVMGLGFDKIRTETVKSIIEPDMLITCYTYNTENNIESEIRLKNENLINGSILTLALPISNFVGMIDKLCELVFDLTREGQVIIVPDGAKPLIMAMSLIPDIVNKIGVTCLHISRNCCLPYNVKVTPRENEIYGFYVFSE